MVRRNFIIGTLFITVKFTLGVQVPKYEVCTPDLITIPNAEM